MHRAPYDEAPDGEAEISLHNAGGRLQEASAAARQATI
jgi:hypothetical protein